MISIGRQAKPSRRNGWAFFFALALPVWAVAEETKVRFKFERGKPMVVELTGLPDSDYKQLKSLQMPDFPAILSIRVSGASTDLAGNYSLTEAGIHFESRHAPGPGTKFRAVYNPARLSARAAGQSVTAEATAPNPATMPATVLDQIYPSGDQLPENQLRFYLHFSAPMSRHDAYRHVKLLDEKGKEVASPFLELSEELWDPAGKRLTLLLHPGRIKRGLKPREELGPILEEGKRYTLVVAADWTDAEGSPLKGEVRKSFRVGAPDETQPDPRKWTVTAPTAGGSEAVVVRVEKPLDHALLARLLWVVDAGGKRVVGTAVVSDGETRWSFMPAKPWPAGSYRLVVDTALEDRAGNSVARPFELDLVQPRPQQTPKVVERAFEVK
jgi:hypothetical protein